MTQRHRPLPALLTLLLTCTCGCGNTTDNGAGDLDEAASGLMVSVHADQGSIVVASWEQHSAAQVRVEYSFDDEGWHASPDRDLSAGSHEQILLGIPYGTEVAVRLVLESGEATSDEVSITTDDLPAGIPTPSVVTADEAGWDPDSPFVLAGLEDWTVVLDRQGRVVWAMAIADNRISLQPQPSYDGSDFLIDHGSFWAIFDGGRASQVARVKIDGSIVQTYDTPGLHHPFTELADGSIVWAAMEDDDETIEELSPAGEQTTIASCRALLGSFGDVGYCGSNTIRWHEDSDTLLYSLYSHDSILEVDHTTGDLVRSFGQHDGSWDFDPPDSAFWWQHGGHFTDEGTLLTSSHAGDDSIEMVVHEYELDEDAGVLREIWTFGEGEGVYAMYMGEAHRLPGGNTLHNYGSNPRLREVSSDGTVVWEIAWEGVAGQWELGRTTPLVDLYAFAP